MLQCVLVWLISFDIQLDIDRSLNICNLLTLFKNFNSEFHILTFDLIQWSGDILIESFLYFYNQCDSIWQDKWSRSIRDTNISFLLQYKNDINKLPSSCYNILPKNIPNIFIGRWLGSRILFYSTLLQSSTDTKSIMPQRNVPYNIPYKTVLLKQ